MLDRFGYAFYCDGSFRDLLIFDTTMDDWRTLFAILRSGDYDLEFSMGDVVDLPDDPDDVVQLSRKHTDYVYATLKVRFGPHMLNNHFHLVNEIEFDLDPRDVKTEDDLGSLFAFVRRTARALRKDAVITEESMPDAQLIRYRFLEDDFVKAGDPAEYR
ncbi:MAG: hypothetical protein ACHQY2_04805 [Candidatus Eremiobacterales bacterium]|jgi:hypothetical protein